MSCSGFEYKVGHQDSGPSNSHQGHMLCWNIIMIVVEFWAGSQMSATIVMITK